MVTPLSRCCFFSAAALAVLFLCQCKSTQTVTTRSTSFSFNQKDWGGLGEPGEVDNKIASRGYSIGEDGKIKADKPDLYKDMKPRGLDGEFGTKKAKFRKDQAKIAEFRKPEYLKRQEFRGVNEAREGGASAREGDFDESRDRFAGKLFNKKSKEATSLASFDTTSSISGEQTFATGSDRVGSTAIDNSVRAEGRPQMMGYQDNASMSVDDVKKLLSPNTYARATGLSE